MKRTQRRDALRNVAKQKVSFLSIVVIAMLAVMAYLGIRYASRSMRDSGNAFYEATRFRDLEIISTKLVTEADLADLRAAEGVSAAEGVRQTTGVLQFGGVRQNAAAVSLTGQVNTPMLLEGRLPGAENECAVEKELADAAGLRPGDVLLLQDAEGGPAAYLRAESFTVTGIVYHPDNACYQMVAPGLRYVIVRPEAFDTEALDGAYMKAVLLLDLPGKTDRLDEGYVSAVDAAAERLRPLGERCGARRDEEIRGKYGRELDDGQAELDRAAETLNDARAQLEDGAAQIAENQKKIRDAERTLVDALKKLSAGGPELSANWRVLADAKEQLDAGKAELDAGKALLDEKRAELAAARGTLDGAKRELDAGKAKLEAGEKEVASGEAELAAGREKLDDAAAQIASGEAELAAAEKELTAAETEYAEGEAQLESGAEELKAGWALIEDKKEEIRGTVRTGLETALLTVGVPAADVAAAVNAIPWTAKNAAPDLGDPALDAVTFRLAENIAVPLSQVDYAETVSAAMTRFDNLFDLALFMLQMRGVDTTAVAAGKNAVRTYVQSALDGAAALESAYNESVAQLQTWNDGHAQYLDGAAALSAARAQIDEGRAQYEEGAAALAGAKAAYADGLAEYEAGRAQVEAGRAELDAGRKTYEENLAKYNDGEAQYAEGLALFEQGEADYGAALAQYNGMRALYEDGLVRYGDGLAQFLDGAGAYADGRAQVEDAKIQLDEGRELLAEKEAEYEDGLAQYRDGVDRLGEARSELDGMEPTRWVFLGPNGNAGYNITAGSTKNVGAMGSTFALLFVLVGALVIYATVGRIVDEQRRLVGATKALGFFNREIFAKYLLFGVSATAIGMVLGILVGYFVIQTVLCMTYGRNQVFGAGAPAFAPGITAIVLASGLLLSALTVWSACRELLRATATSLMQEKTPSVKAKGRANTMSLYWRMIFLNIRTDKKRVAVTVASVAGCCALLVTGFTLRTSIVEALGRQFEEVCLYDAKIDYDAEISETAGEEIRAALRAAGAEWMEICSEEAPFSINGTFSSTLLMCGDLSEMDGYYARRDPKTGAPLPDSGDGVFVHLRVAEKFGVGVGDEIVFYDSDMKAYPTRIAGVFNVYAGMETLISPRAYESLFGRAPENNAFLMHNGRADTEALRAELREIRGLEDITDTQQLKETYQAYAGVLDIIAGLLTVMAGLMAYFILLNLANMYVNQKKRELTIMRVNGFTVREAILYVAGEAVATTAIGILFGFAAGSLLARRLISLIESANVQFIRGVQISAWLISALITAGFSAAIYAVALRKVKRLKLTDVA